MASFQSFLCISFFVCLMSSTFAMPFVPDPEDDVNMNEIDAGKFEEGMEEIPDDEEIIKISVPKGDFEFDEDEKIDEAQDAEEDEEEGKDEEEAEVDEIKADEEEEAEEDEIKADEEEAEEDEIKADEEEAEEDEIKADEEEAEEDEIKADEEEAEEDEIKADEEEAEEDEIKDEKFSGGELAKDEDDEDSGKDDDDDDDEDFKPVEEEIEEMSGEEVIPFDDIDGEGNEKPGFVSSWYAKAKNFFKKIGK